MNIECEEEPVGNKKDDIFHYLQGGYFFDEKEKLYNFILQSQPNKLQISYYKTNSFVLIADPGYDATFKVLFLNNSVCLQNFLNCIYFEDNNMKLTNLEYLVGDYNEIGATYNLNNLRSDIACKAKVNMEKDLLLDVEIQINWIDNLENRLFEYGTLLRNMDTKTLYSKEKQKEKEKNNNENENVIKKSIKKIYNDTIVIAFILDNKKIDKNSSKIELVKTENNDDKIKTTLNGFTIIEINVFKEINEIQRNNKVKLFNNILSKDGADWLKLIGLRFWAEKDESSFGKYILPKLNKNDKYSKNEFLNYAIISLIGESQINITFYSNIENAMYMQYNDGIEQGEKKTQLRWAYNLFINNQKDALNYLNFDYKYKENEVFTILADSNDQKSLELFIKYLKENDCVS